MKNLLKSVTLSLALLSPLMGAESASCAELYNEANGAAAAAANAAPAQQIVPAVQSEDARTSFVYMGRFIPTETLGHILSFLETEDIYNLRKHHPAFNIAAIACNKDKIYRPVFYYRHLGNAHLHPYPGMVTLLDSTPTPSSPYGGTNSGPESTAQAAIGIPHNIANIFPNIQRLGFMPFNLRTNSTIRNISQLQHLNYFDLYNTKEPITTETLLCLQNTKGLVDLSITNNGYVNDNVVIALSRLEKLKRLDLGDCYAITDASIEALSNSQSLRALRLMANGHLTNASIEALKKSNITYLSLCFCPQITPEAIEALREAKPDLEIEYLR